MSKELSFTHEDAKISKSIIKKGQRIYNIWKKEKAKSRNIIASVESAVTLKNEHTTKRTQIEALAYLYALDLRIKGKYKNRIKRLIGYFSWRRESRTLENLMFELDLPEKKTLRVAIEVELEKIREKIGLDEEEEDEDGKEGSGDRVESEDEEEIISEDVLADQNIENTSNKEHDAEKFEGASEKEDSENFLDNDNITDRDGAQKDSNDPINRENVNFENSGIGADKEGSRVKIDDLNIQDEINGFEKKFEPTINKEQQQQQQHPSAYDNAIDFVPPIFEEKEKISVDTDTPNFIDEVMIDNIIKGKEDFVFHNPVQDLQREPLSKEIINNMLEQQNQNNAEKDDPVNGRDAHLYDKGILQSLKSSGNMGYANNDASNSTVQPSVSNTVEANKPAEPQDDQFLRDREQQLLKDMNYSREHLSVNEVDEVNSLRLAANDLLDNNNVILMIKSALEVQLQAEMDAADQNDLANNNNQVHDDHGANNNRDAGRINMH